MFEIVKQYLEKIKNAKIFFLNWENEEMNGVTSESVGFVWKNRGVNWASTKDNS